MEIRKRHCAHHPAYQCLDCGKPVWRKNARCHRCAAIFVWQQGHPAKPASRCVDCNKPVSKDAKRCYRCNLQWLHATVNTRATGENNVNWKGDKTMSSSGYVLLYKPEHPRAGKGHRVLEHIVVWEEANGKSLPAGWIIHHLNGIKTDNRLKNLVALPSKKHYLVLEAKAKRIQELEGLLKSQNQLL